MRKLLPVLLLAGCTTIVESTPISVPKPLMDLPDPVITNKIHWNAESDKIWLTPEDGIKVNAERKDMVRYIKSLQLITCYHEPKYSFCDSK